MELANVIREKILYRCDSVKDFDVGRLSWMIGVGLQIQSQMSQEENTARDHTQRRGEDDVNSEAETRTVEVKECQLPSEVRRDNE